MTNIKVMADYGCFPLWDVSQDTGPSNVDPAMLPISPELRRDLMNWANEFDATLNAEDPPSSGFSAPEDERRFKEAAHALAQRLQQELGSAVKIQVKV
jgi:hypothetical protein